jgi:heme-degrading monooxygenase HmoA
MILEAAFLPIKPDQSAAFEAAFRLASKLIASIDGYVSHSLRRCLEVEGRYLLLVEWDTLKSHTVGFRTSPQYQEWKTLLHHFYEPFPVVEHFEEVAL